MVKVRVFKGTALGLEAFCVTAEVAPNQWERLTVTETLEEAIKIAKELEVTEQDSKLVYETKLGVH